jgi:hypothetical protein
MQDGDILPAFLLNPWEHGDLIQKVEIKKSNHCIYYKKIKEVNEFLKELKDFLSDHTETWIITNIHQIRFTVDDAKAELLKQFGKELRSPQASVEKIKRKIKKVQNVSFS